ncbi:MAG TPA: erythromycin esterase family protein [Trueperaceae bacterium]
MFRDDGPLVADEVVELRREIERVALDLDRREDLDPLIDRIGDARVVMLGEASHGTSEYYSWRALISQRLIREKGFSFIAVEGDWPDCYRVNRYVKGYPGSGESAREVLHAFERWPTWMWANWEVAALAEWMSRHNRSVAQEEMVGFYGLDVYSLWESLEAIMGYLERADPEALETARRAYSCFEPYNEDVHSYAEATAFVPTSCEEEVVALLAEVRGKAPRYPEDREASFDAEQNARSVVGAERYYRTMVRGSRESWNERDRHMMGTLEALLEHHGSGAKAIVWEHNTHIGDARATDMADSGMVNTGQLARERYGQEGTVLVGFCSHHGSVIAGPFWGAPMERMTVPPAREGSWEEIFHRAGARNRLLFTDRLSERARKFRDHRAIGVVYEPRRERFGNYVPTILPQRYDAFLFLERTEALHPLHIEPREPGPPETYPWGV